MRGAASRAWASCGGAVDGAIPHQERRSSKRLPHHQSCDVCRHGSARAFATRHNHAMNSADDPVTLGTAALARGDWAGARPHFETAIGHGETGAGPRRTERRSLLARRIRNRASDHRSRAYALYRERATLCRAARAALWLAIGYISVYGNAAAANGWLQRAEGLLEEAGPCSERGWFEHLRGKMSPDAATTARHARQAVEIARRHRRRRPRGVGAVGAGPGARLHGARGRGHGHAGRGGGGGDGRRGP